jgi:5-formyltetrahydrofolate cyclo-ligase
MEIVLPATTSPTTMVFRRHAAGAPLAAGGFGTLAPPPDQPVRDPDLIVMPLVAFDRSGARLGHGRGFYDRVLADLHARGVTPMLVGIAFSVQEVRAIPAEAHDVPLDRIVTEAETIVPDRRK